LNELVKIVKDKRVLFYSGAGFSLASKVPAMNELNELLGMEMGENLLLSLEHAIDNPKKFVERIKVFHDACVYNDPNDGHLALKALVLLPRI
jgi:NAD-dependent SIR2 family protein deacetylase